MDAKLDTLGFRFFKLFAQYEYALKVMGYWKDRNGNRVEPDWDRFANDIGTVIHQDPSPDVSAARDYILDAPPKRQIVKEGQIAWEKVPNGDRSSQALFGHLRRVRNNLYHGGKFNGVWFAPDRSFDLMTRAVLLLETLREAHPELKKALAGNAA